MSRSQRVVWSEGLFLTPHLFQQHERYHEDLLHFRLKPFTPFYWGLLDYDIDTDTLTNGSFRLNRCNGIMPDGLPIQMPANDPLPPNRSFKEEKIFPSSAATLDVFLAIPEEQVDRVNVSLDGATNGAAARYQMQLAQVADDTTGGNEHEISLARKNYKILFSGERLDGHILLKIAEVARTPSGTFSLQDYIPASLSISASNQLMTILRGLWDILSTKSSGISAQRRHITEFAGSDIANFWLLHTANSYIPILSHFYNAKHHHPEHLYLVLCQLAGQLTTFAMDASPRDLPLYEHDNLHQTFTVLDRTIRRLVETVIPTRFVIIPLDKREQWHVGQVHDDRLLGTAKFYLGVRAQVAANKLIQEIPIKAKISSPGEINDLIGRAVSGIELTHEAVPPSDIPVAAGFRYFQLNTQGRWWEVIRQSKGLAIYIADEFPELELQLIAVRDL
jgi:type VI secretion system protein ImpJ